MDNSISGAADRIFKYGARAKFGEIAFIRDELRMARNQGHAEGLEVAAEWLELIGREELADDLRDQRGVSNA